VPQLLSSPSNYESAVFDELVTEKMLRQLIRCKCLIDIGYRAASPKKAYYEEILIPTALMQFHDHPFLRLFPPSCHTPPGKWSVIASSFVSNVVEKTVGNEICQTTPVAPRYAGFNERKELFLEKNASYGL
jgi:hypothetical protein